MLPTTKYIVPLTLKGPSVPQVDGDLSEILKTSVSKLSNLGQGTPLHLCQLITCLFMIST